MVSKIEIGRGLVDGDSDSEVGCVEEDNYMLMPAPTTHKHVDQSTEMDGNVTLNVTKPSA